MRPAHLACSRDDAHRFAASALATVCPRDGAPPLVRSSRIAEEAGAALAALRALLARGTALAGPVVLFNTGSALKYGPRG